jgi:hypothetical protein
MSNLPTTEQITILKRFGIKKHPPTKYSCDAMIQRLQEETQEDAGKLAKQIKDAQNNFPEETSVRDTKKGVRGHVGYILCSRRSKETIICARIHPEYGGSITVPIDRLEIIDY